MTCDCKDMCKESVRRADSLAKFPSGRTCRIDSGPKPYVTVEQVPGGYRPVMKAVNPDSKEFEVMAWDQGIDRGWWEAHNRALDWAIQAKLELR